MKFNYINYYELLGLRENCSNPEIEVAYKEASKKYHPDKQGNTESSIRLFQYINDARRVLSDPIQKKTYDSLINNTIMNNTTQSLSNTDQNTGGALLIVGLLGIWLGSEIGQSSKRSRR